MSALVILESDPSVRDILRQALLEVGLSGNCTVEDAGEVRKPDHNKKSYIWCGRTGASFPEELSIRENDCFYRPLRLGLILDRVLYHHVQIENAPQILSVGPYEMNCIDNTLKAGRKKDVIRLTEKEGEILKFLAVNKGKVIQRQTLLGAVWGYTEGLETHTLETHIYRLRQKMEKNPARPEILLTEEDGYRLA